MAWDALSSLFKKKDTEATDLTRQARTGVQGAGSVGGGAPSAAPVAQSFGYGGAGGGGGGPVGAGFANFGTLYGLNEEKAKGMAGELGAKVQGHGEAAKGALNTAQGAFNAAASQGTGRGPKTGPHGTRVGNATAASGPTAAPSSDNYWIGSSAAPGNYTTTGEQRPVYDPPSEYGQTRDGLQGTGTRTSDNLGMGTGYRGNAAGQMFASLQSPPTNAGKLGEAQSAAYLGSPSAGPDTKANAANYADWATELDAKSGAGQAYTGPASLKDSMGEEAYAKTQDELRKASEAAQGLTNAGGIATQLGYDPGQSPGMSALDTGLTQVAGQQNFRRLAERYGGLSKLLPAAQADSLRAAAGGATQSAAAAADWQKLLDEYTAANPNTRAVDPNAPVVIRAAQGESTGDRIGEGARIGGTGAPESGPNYDAVMSAGYSKQDINDVWSSLTREEQLWLFSGDVGTKFQDTMTGGSAKDIEQSVLAKLAAARAKKNESA